MLEASGKGGQRLVWLKRATQARPDHAPAWYELGRAEIGAGDSAAGFAAFDGAAQLDPADADARRDVGSLALRLGRWDAAETALAGDDDDEALLARYRIAAERGEDVGTRL